MRAKKNGYANIYVSTRIDDNGRRVWDISPGACSEGNSRRATNEYLPARGFADIFDATIDAHAYPVKVKTPGFIDGARQYIAASYTSLMTAIHFRNQH